MRPTPAEVLRRRTAERAYYAWLNGHPGDAEAHWLFAERLEGFAAERRRAAALTREYNKGH